MGRPSRRSRNVAIQSRMLSGRFAKVSDKLLNADIEEDDSCFDHSQEEEDPIIDILLGQMVIKSSKNCLERHEYVIVPSGMLEQGATTATVDLLFLESERSCKKHWMQSQCGKLRAIL